ncbi:MAG TPA: signal peptidase I [Candidatus Methylacidiphilales bacterium]|jgi:signal peptidase I|nr:signal peptidase I [Candidatus Methylacidiphilales bacterium]
MFNFFLPAKTKKVLAESELIQGSLHRHRVYAQDVLSTKDLDAVMALEARYPALLKARDVEGLEKLNKEVMKLGNKLFPPSPWDGWRENVEVFVVAAIMALAIRTFFLQPFSIPTGSMEPTLYGIEPRPTTEMPPNALDQTFDFLIHGKTYSRVVTEHGGMIDSMTSGSFTIWLEYTDVHIGDETDRIWIRASDVRQKLHLEEGMQFPPGAVLANYITQTGDKVLVDKVTYNFRPPRRGEVFIFKTSGIAGLADENGPNQEGSEDFIKRCVGLAGDLIEVKPPVLYVNGKPAEGAPSFAMEFAQTDDYPGYSLIEFGDGPVGMTCTGVTKDTSNPIDPRDPASIFNQNNSQTYYVPANCYWAMGDNSPNSKDSRYWGGVPRQNLVGRGYFVFWPFTKRWGWIK